MLTHDRDRIITRLSIFHLLGDYSDGFFVTVFFFLITLSWAVNEGDNFQHYYAPTHTAHVVRDDLTELRIEVMD